MSLMQLSIPSMISDSTFQLNADESDAHWHRHHCPSRIQWSILISFSFHAQRGHLRLLASYTTPFSAKMQNLTLPSSPVFSLTGPTCAVSKPSAPGGWNGGTYKRRGMDNPQRRATRAIRPSLINSFLWSCPRRPLIGVPQKMKWILLLYFK